MKFTGLVFLTACLLGVAQARGMSPNPIGRGAAEIRRSFQDFFHVDFHKATQKKLPSALLKVATQSSFPFLSQKDISMSMTRGFINDGGDVPLHVHPRGAETVYCIKGKIKAVVKPETKTDSDIVINLSAGDATALPRAIPHALWCIKGQGSCEYFAVLDSPDPGAYSVSV